MTLTNEETRLIFNHFFRCTKQEQIGRGSLLITSNSEAAEFYSCIKKTLAQFACKKNEGCLTKLVEITIDRLKLAAIKDSLPHKYGLY
jgi:hypothetical protein